MNNKKRWMVFMAIVLALVMLNSLVFAVDSGAREVVEPYPPPPPPVRMEEPPVAPAPVDVWTPGHWEWNGREYVWAQGQWVEPPYANAVWVPSHWEWNGRDWVWIAGHWQQ